jgi:putative nucleotidyltransferase with HDIG domain
VSLLDSKVGLLLIASQMLLATGLFATQAPMLSGPLPLFVFLVVMQVFANQHPIQVYGDTYISVGFVFTAAVIVMFGAPGVAVAAPFAAASLTLARKNFDFRDLYNIAMFVVVCVCSGAVYESVSTVSPGSFSGEMVPAVALAAAASFILTGLSLGSFMRLYDGKPLAEFWKENAWLGPHYIVFGLIGLSLALAYIALGYAGILAFLAPILMLRIAIKQYVDKTRENVERLRKQNEQLRTANIEIIQVKDDLQTSYDGTLEALVNALDARDQETKGHSIRVSRYMLDIAREMGVVEGSREWVDMQRGSLLHDVGKIGVRDAILLKPGKLTEEEWVAMRKHPEIGYNMLRQVRFLEGAAEIILAHHERWDGKGYPRGMRGEEIPLGARIFTVVDTFDSMTSDRPYRNALSTEQALQEVLRCRGGQFDPRVVEAFLEIYGTWVKQHDEMYMDAEGIPRAA